MTATTSWKRQLRFTDDVTNVEKRLI